jgi:ribulose-phosphate 3-epimerase
LIKIAPSILSADFSKLKNKIKEVETAGADMLHIDVMDGLFVPNITIGPVVIESIKKVTNLPLDVHLMIDNPGRYIEDFIHAGADIITIHIEACKHLHKVIESIKSNNIKAGIALNPATSLMMGELIYKYCDMIVIMSVNPGFGGQKFIPDMLSKITKAREIINNLNTNIDLEVDGGVNRQNIKSITDAGANLIVVGSTVFGAKDRAEAIHNLRIV